MKKKCLTYCLVLSMVLSASTPVFAAEQIDFVVESEEESEVTLDSETEISESEEISDDNNVAFYTDSNSFENSNDDFSDSFSDGSDTVESAGDAA